MQSARSMKAYVIDNIKKQETSSLGNRRRWRLVNTAIGALLIVLFLYSGFQRSAAARFAAKRGRFARVGTPTLDSQIPARYNVNTVDIRNRGFTKRQAEDTHWMCAKRFSSSSASVVDRRVLWTKAVTPNQRRILYSGFEPVEFSLTDDESCLGYTQVPRIVDNRPMTVKPEEIFFGLASDRNRIVIEKSVPANWLHKSNTNLFVSIPKSDADNSETSMKEYFADLGLHSFHPIRDLYHDDQSMRYARLSASMYELTRKQSIHNIKWFVHLDDDTFVTNVQDYARMLSKYNHTEPLYIGAHSESSSAGWRDGRGAWGGASVIVSRALAEQLSRDWEECQKRFGHTIYGDHKLDAAVAYTQQRPRQNPDIRLEKSLHQLDLWGQIDGFLRGGAEVWLTLHHFGWFDIAPGVDKWDQFTRIALASRFLGSQNLFRNYLLDYSFVDHHNGTVSGKATVLTNGYVVTEYYVPLPKEDLELMEMTWQDNNVGDYHAALGPFRDVLKEGTEKKTYWLIEVKERPLDDRGNRGSTWLYRHDGGDDGLQDFLVEWME